MSQTYDDLVLRFGGSLVEQLGAQMYPSVTATVAELISNAWDADAKNVWITIPFDSEWTANSEILVVDDGNGMTRQLAQDAYLIVGRRRRLTPLGALSEGGRPVHGRKGIGKLAAFGTAGILECSSLREGERTDFLMDYDEIRKLQPTEDYHVERVVDPPPLTTPENSALAHGTRIRLSKLRLKRAVSKDQFLLSMSRRFALNQNDMKVLVNGDDTLESFNIKTEFRFPRDGVPNDDITVSQDDWAEEVVGGKRVRWWIGFTALPLEEDQQQGVSILASGKMAQRPFQFERSQGTEGQLGQEYLVGEVVADWLDEIEDDLIQSNRDQLQLEDHRLVEFLAWGRRRLAWALRERAKLKREKSLAEFEAGEEVEALLESYTATEKKRLLGVAKAISRIPEIDQAGITSTMRSVVDAQADRAVREMMEQIEQEDDAMQERVWQLVHEFGLVDARRTLSIVEARLATIRKLQMAVDTGAKEIPELHNIVLNDPWLLDPRWNLLDDEVSLTDLGVQFVPEQDEKGNRLDFLFGLAPHAPAPMDEVVVVEIKRGTDAAGNVRKATDAEVNKFHGYVLAVQEHHAKSSERVTVRGLMIAQGYTSNAELLRKSLEANPSVDLAFKTWHRVIGDTERMHTGWLEVSKERIAEDRTKPG